MDVDQAGRHQTFDTEQMVMGLILIPKPVQGCTHICATGCWKLQGAPRTSATVDWHPLEVAVDHSAGEFAAQGSRERFFHEKCMSP